MNNNVINLSFLSPFSSNHISSRAITQEIRKAPIVALTKGIILWNPSEKTMYIGPNIVPIISRLRVCFSFLF